MIVCEQCGATAPDGLVCFNCHRLIHAKKLDELARKARQAESASDSLKAVDHWRQALVLLPASTKQYEIVARKIQALEGTQPTLAPPPPRLGKWLARLGPLGLVIWKFKAILLFAATKGKLLVFGLTKLTTLSSMLLTLSIYWGIYGWTFALGIILSIYIHEMGHVSELARFGIPASPPMFIPGFGALVSLRAAPKNVWQDARIGLAGPVWGTAAALAAALVYFLSGSAYWGVIARWGAWINLFNLFPVWQLDGGRAFRALTRHQRGIALGVIVVLWILSEDMMLLLLGGGAVYRLFSKDFAPEPDQPILLKYCLLAAVLAALCLIRIDLPVSR